jgi:hypothetical protein
MEVGCGFELGNGIFPTAGDSSQSTYSKQLNAPAHWQPRCKRAEPEVATVLYRRPLQLPHIVRQVIELAVTVSAVALLSYLVLQTRW